MNLWSISVSYRLGLGFHALNNEGADGSNLMQPRRIDVGSTTYDGISGEIIRHHVLEHFVNVCRQEGIPMFPLSEGLHPDRGPMGIRVAAKALKHKVLTNECLFQSVREAIASCAVLDVGGYLAAWKEQDAAGPKKGYVAEKPYEDAECVPQGDVQPVKRESCFDVAWLISENPQDLTVTQHSAFRDTFTMNSRYAQTMRSNVYAGVVRADLHRIGTDDYWYLQPGCQGNARRYAIDEPEQARRQQALVWAIANFILSPTGAKVAAWAPHVFLTEGVILLSRKRTAPFVSPLKVDLCNLDAPVAFDKAYRDKTVKLNSDGDIWTWQFDDAKGLLDALCGISGHLGVGNGR